MVCSVALATQDPGTRQVSPNGRKVAYLVRDSERIQQLSVKNIDGTHLRQITFLGERNYPFPPDAIDQGVISFYWSPDSIKIACIVFYCDCQDTARAIQSEYNQATIVVVDVSSLATVYLGGKDFRFFPDHVNIFDISWSDSNTVRYRYKLRSGLAGIKERKISAGRSVQADESFLGLQAIVSVITEMISGQKQIKYSGPPSGKNFIDKLFAKPKLSVTNVWSGYGTPGGIFTVVVWAPGVETLCPEAQKFPGVYLLVEQGVIIGFVGDGSP